MTAVDVTREGAVATVTLNRPDKLNALDRSTRWELIGALREVAVDHDVRAVVLTGAGRAFCVGQDLAAVEELEHADETVAGSYNPIAQTIADMPKPVVAAVNGAAVGAGLGLALACDLRLAAESASFSCAFGKVGLVPDTGVSWHLVRELGYARAFAVATLGRTFTADEAKAYGLINRVLPPEQLAASARELAGMLADGPSLAFALTKSQFRAAGELPLEALLALEARHQGEAAAHPDHVEGRTAFAEKRAPRWA
ncbi:enoyl-CoA hydratase/isomerase family protein [Blastococcus haudaquaticus]|uniref:Short chain enoyl-CoA hydratase /Enoyl-CoA hydratase n=1 Tax=Blastococcus haudaquaticus TaxID=1938745 RepID=A0A286GR03_9ACTN|nr:enoyl-CoA hydratase-related protein [Blastococcus haudaquaticus]SOD97987.1 short chain enoyl-CoA hydratase /Enoyl-CoA hydratase [Blastococcus haudaquaticus]